LIDLASTAASLTFNNEVKATLNPAWNTDVYQFRRRRRRFISTRSTTMQTLSKRS
jgi:hypothetical protein